MAESKPDKKPPVRIQNRKARFEFHIEKSWEAGIVLQGTEVKSCRAGNANFTDSFAYMKDGELWLKDFYIKEFEQGNINNHDPRRVRKLLLHREELQKIDRAMKEKGFTLVPLTLYFKQGKVKIEIGLAKGKKLHDKRASIAERDVKRELDRLKKI